jgi:uncharacterized damage-inducible protein DinB
MISPAYAQLMARYNAEMNRRFYAAAARLSDDERHQDRGAFFGSIHATLNHLMWCDRVWLSRLTGAPLPSGTREESPRFISSFEQLASAREEADAALVAWAQTIDQQTLDTPHEWFAGTSRAFVTTRGVMVAHMFNHQTHHRGQVHALLTAFGQDTAETDLWTVARDHAAVIG